MNISCLLPSFTVCVTHIISDDLLVYSRNRDAFVESSEPTIMWSGDATVDKAASTESSEESSAAVASSDGQRSVEDKEEQPSEGAKVRSY